MKPIILVRHAQSQHHVNGLTGGWTDTGLTDLGRRQAAYLVSRLKQELEGKLVRMVCSALKRAWQPHPRAETWRQFYQRVAGVMERLAGEQEELLFVVTHGGTLVNIVAWWLQLDIEVLSRLSFGAHPASVSVFGSNQWGDHELERLNDTAHLYAAGLAEGLLKG